MPSSAVDAVVTDPPWNIGKDYGAHDDALPAERYIGWLAAVLAECARVAAGPVVFLPGACNAAQRAALMARAGLSSTTELTWRKPVAEPVLWTNAEPPSRVPATIWAPEPPAHDPRMARHPCPKPLALMRLLVEAATPVGGTVLDPFAGTGTTLVAAASSGRHAIGIELERRYCAVARRRLARRSESVAARGSPR